MARQETRPFYRTAAWRAARRAALMRDGYSCQICGQRAQEVHHLIELNENNVNDPSIALALDNLQSLCHDCHTRLTAREHRQGGSDAGDEFYFDAQGFLQKLPGGGTPPGYE